LRNYSNPFVVEMRDVDRDFDLGPGQAGKSAGPVKLHALARVSLKLSHGEFVFLTGPSGAGKSTLLRIIMGLDNPSSGEVITLGKNLNQMSETKRRQLRQEIGLVFQDHKLLPTLNVFENVELPLSFRGLATKERNRRVEEMLEVVQMKDHMFSPVHVLSAGERQRIAIARALVTCPSLIIADEPTGNLDPKSARGLVRLLRELKGHGTTVLIATHDMGLVRDFGGRILELVGGTLPSQRNKIAQHNAYKIPRFWRTAEKS